MVFSASFAKRLIGPVLLFIVSALLVTAGPLAEARSKIRINSLDQLPRHSYELSCPLAELLSSPALFKAFSSKVRADLEADLDTYDIEDRTTLERWQAVLVTLDMLDGRYDSALEGLSIMMELQEKPARKHTSGLMDRSMVAALRAAGSDTASLEFREVFRQELSARVEQLPRDIVLDEVEQMKGVLEMFSEAMLLGLVQAQFEPAVEKSGSISQDLALQVINVQNFLTYVLPVKDDIVEILGAWVEAGRTTAPDIWESRSVNLSRADPGRPVVVAIWDTGVDVELFRDLLFTNPGEEIDGRDSDGNGFIDDRHGIAYDQSWHRTSGLLYPLKELEPRIGVLTGMIKGYFDLQSAIDSPEAAAIKDTLSSLTAGEVGRFFEDLTRCAIHVHGTHVAGRAAEGNPFIRILTTRLEPDYGNVPDLPTVQTAGRAAAAFQDIVDYYKKNEVRIVNLSWGIELRQIERGLEKNGFGSDAGERAVQARKIFEIMCRGLRDAIGSASGILFVAAAGNSDADVAFEEFCPSSFDLPNLMAVGAVDRSGRETSFTCFGDRIGVYSNGFEIEGSVPGGQRMSFSGTSLAAPQVVNLAAKLAALEPSLTPPDLIELIEAGATKSEGKKPVLLIHPKKSLELLRNRMTRDGSLD